jgi:uncharacterized protein YydD (DUF2326 family)
MKLLSLRSTNPNFKTLEFKDGLNVLAGIQRSNEKKDTYNGVGKSFSLNLLHLMFGGKIRSYPKRISEFLAEYGTFFLDFEHRDKPYSIEKNFSKPSYVLNGKVVTAKDYPDELRKIFLSGCDEGISFKQVFNVFCRRYGGGYYSDILKQQGQPSADYHQMYLNLYLLGLDMSLVRRKAVVKERLKELRETRKVVQNYEKALDRSNTKDVKEELDRLVADKDKFIIAQNYDAIEREADERTRELNEIRDRIHDLNERMIRKLSNIDSTRSVDIDVERVKQIYDEANFFFEGKVVHRLREASEFHKNLVRSRIKRLNQEIENLRTETAYLDDELNRKAVIRDGLLKNLDSSGALSEYNSIVDRIRTLGDQIHDLNKYKNVIDGFRAEESELAVKNAEIQADSIKYLSEIEDYRESLENRFRQLVKSFYRNNGGSFGIQSTQDAKYLFGVSAHIPRDLSQGVGEVKIFCYDFLLFQLNPELLGFIAHDGCIFSEMDPRQKSMIFKVAMDHVQSYDLQYFVNIGQASLEEVLDEEGSIGLLSDEEKREVKHSVIMTLYDNDPQNWLFGTRFG